MRRNKLTFLTIGFLTTATAVDVAIAQSHRKESKEPQKKSYRKEDSGSKRRTVVRTRPGQGSVRRSTTRRIEHYHRHHTYPGGPTVAVYPGYSHRTRVVHLPHGHRVIHYHDRTIYYYRHTFYEPSYIDGEVVYVAMDPPTDVILEEIPDDSTTVIVGGETYYYGGGLFYRRVSGHGGVSFSVSTAPIGAVVYTIPDDCTTTVVRGTTYYRYGGVHYRRVFDHGRVSYMVVSSPD